jgi:pilus assembly protein Flp/PilA
MGQAARVDDQPGRVSHAGSGFAAAADAARSSVRDFAAKACGATAIEYALIAALISLAIITALGTLGSQMSDMYLRIVNAMP